MASYPYQALPQQDFFRLLLLQPASNPSTDVRCELIQNNIIDCGEDIIDHYTALSYVWGDATDKRLIFVNGLEFFITVNLFLALSDLRDEKRVLRLWADAICINQNDEQEKSQQVGMMGSIFAAAKYTIIYLGPSSPDSEEVFDDLRKSDRSRELSEDPVIHIRVRELAVRTIWSSEWFRRVWVFQELVLSADPFIQRGRSRARWRSLSNLHLADSPLDSRNKVLAGDQSNPEASIFTSMEEARLILQTSLASVPYPVSGRPGWPYLYNLLCARRGCGVTNPRDMIFGHLGIATTKSLTSLGNSSDQIRLSTWNIEVDYRQSISFIYQQIAFRLSEESNDLRVLNLIENVDPNEKKHDLPTWVPDWTTVHPSDSSLFDQKNDDNIHNAVPLLWIPEMSSMVCSGYEAGEIEQLSSIIPGYKASLDKSQEREAMFPEGLRNLLVSTSSKTEIQWFITSRFANLEPLQTDASRKKKRGPSIQVVEDLLWASYNAWTEELGSGILPPKLTGQNKGFAHLARLMAVRVYEPREPLAPWLSFYNGGVDPRLCLLILMLLQYSLDMTEENPVKQALVGKRIASVRGGALVLVPSFARVGDTIYRFGNQLVLLRPVPHDALHARLDARICHASQLEANGHLAEMCSKTEDIAQEPGLLKQHIRHVQFVSVLKSGSSWNQMLFAENKGYPLPFLLDGQAIPRIIALH